MQMQHNPSKDTKPDPPGPEYLLMTSVCPVTGGMQGMGAGDSERRMGFFFFLVVLFFFKVSGRVNLLLVFEYLGWCCMELACTPRQETDTHYVTPDSKTDSNP